MSGLAGPRPIQGGTPEPGRAETPQVGSSVTGRQRGPEVPDPRAMAMRRVHRALGELRRGTPVLIRGLVPGGGPAGTTVATETSLGQGLLVAAAETVSARGVAEFAGTEPVLLLSPVRAAALLSRPVELQPSAPREAEAAPVALRTSAALLSPEALRSLADPTLDTLLPERPQPAPVPPLAAAAVALAKLGRLLPALVAAPVAALPPGLIEVPAADILSYPGTAAMTLTRVAEASVPLEDAPEARVVAFRAADGGIEHLAILVGQPEVLAAEGGAPLTRVHSECFTGDLLGSLRCDCGPQLRGALARMAAEGGGVLLYLAQEGRGIGLVNKLRAYALQDRGLDTLDANRALGFGADERSFLVAAEMLRALQIPRVRLLTNNPEKVAGLAACGIEVVARVRHAFVANGVNDGYLDTKARRFGHLFG